MPWRYLRAALIHCLTRSQYGRRGDTYIEAKALLERDIILLKVLVLDWTFIPPWSLNHQLPYPEDKAKCRLKSLIIPYIFAEQGIYTHLTRIMKDQPDASALEDKILQPWRGWRLWSGSKRCHYQKPYKAAPSILTGGPEQGKPLLLTALLNLCWPSWPRSQKSWFTYYFSSNLMDGCSGSGWTELTQLPSATIHDI